MQRFLPRLGKSLFVVVLALVLTAVAAVGLGQRTSEDPPAFSNVASSADTLPVAASRGDLSGVITGLQRRLRKLPGDGRSWASLGLAYVEQARITADPSYYPKAEQALDRATDVAPRDDLVLSARGALATARHDFSLALDSADAALEVNPYSARALAVRVDALTELGRYDEALAAAKAADRLRPGVATFARLSYARELRGDISGAVDLMQRAATASANPADRAFAYYQLGELQRGRGAYVDAARSYDLALRAVPDDPASSAGRARVLAATGQTKPAIAAYEDVVARLPLAEYVVELGELYEATGRRDKAQEQYAVVRAGSALAESNGVNVDLETALFEADHGDPAVAIKAARTEWAKRHSVHAADALGWALHAGGRDREALTYAREATRLGTKDAPLLYHRGMIEAALGLDADARRSLRSALQLDPQFSPQHAPRARTTLDELEAST